MDHSEMNFDGAPSTLSSVELPVMLDCEAEAGDTMTDGRE